MTDHHRRRWDRPLSGAGAAAVLLLALLACKQKSSDKEQAAASAAPPPPTVLPCPKAFKDLPADQRQSAKPIQCTCPAVVSQGSVWGTTVYTTDSSICRAAVHAGVITAAGGEVTVQASLGCKAYAGSDANGITSSDWGPYATSFFFPAKGDGKCPEIEAGGPCPLNFKAIPNRNAQTSFTCTCSPEKMRGSLWGTKIYTTDSSICQAARHVGAVQPSGGSVTVKAAPGCRAYRGSAQNGVQSGNWGPYADSYYFDGHGDGKCVP
jgi:hypothetical protein